MTETSGKDTPRTIIVSDREYGLPYSKGLMANTIMAAGLSPGRAYHAAQSIEDRLLELGKASVTGAEVRRIAVEVIREETGDRWADAYAKWQTVGDLDLPIVILIGGGTGVGKSTIATQLATRLGIVRIISSDAIREIMKGVFTRDIMPTLYTSSFDADASLRGKLPAAEDPVISGFREQVTAVSVGVKALVERAAMEGTDAIIEGAHVVPGFVSTEEFGGQAVVVQLVVAVEDEDLHRSHFSLRARASRARPVQRYLDHFDNIRRIQKYIRSLALAEGVPIVLNYDLDAALASVINLVMTKATEAVRGRAGEEGAVKGAVALRPRGQAGRARKQPVTPRQQKEVRT
jgi:2-phosphoglycerate kinase